MDTMIETPLARLSDEQLDDLARELDAIHDEVFAELGDRDRRYITSMIELHRRLAVLGRVLLFGARYKPAWVAGTATLSLAKILENMEIGHNVMHGQWDWMNDPYIHSSSWDWDSASTPEAWKHSHNYIHHTYTNIRGKDKDLGYKIMRIDPHQKWVPVYLGQPFYNVLLMAFFEWGVAFHDLDLDAIRKGEKSTKALKRELKGMARKAGRQIAKDYIAYPLLSGRKGFKSTLAANFASNVIRNVWAHAIIFCGHFPDQTYTFSEEEVADETRGRYLRPPAARRREHRGQPALPRHQRQPRLPGRAPPLSRHAQHPLRRDRTAGQGDLRALRAALQQRAVPQAVGHRATDDPAPRAARRPPAPQARALPARRDERRRYDVAPDIAERRRRGATASGPEQPSGGGVRVTLPTKP